MIEFQPFADDAVVAFGIAIRAHSERIEQRHVGVVYRDGERVQFLHMAAHHELVCGSCDPSYCYGEVGFDSINKMFLQEFASLVAEKSIDKSISFGFGYQGGMPGPFDRDGVWVDGMSVTCATFVLGLFVSLGYPMVDISSWPSRASDLEWARSMLINYLVTVYESQSDIDRLLEVMPSYVRVRPEEAAVAATGLSVPRPYAFLDVEPPSLTLVNKLVEHASRRR